MRDIRRLDNKLKKENRSAIGAVSICLNFDKVIQHFLLEADS